MLSGVGEKVTGAVLPHPSMPAQLGFRQLPQEATPARAHLRGVAIDLLKESIGHRDHHLRHSRRSIYRIAAPVSLLCRSRRPGATVTP